MIYQKLIWGAALFFIGSIFSCTTYSKNQLAVFSSFNESMETSTKFAKAQNLLLYEVLKEKVAETATAERAKRWKPVADDLRDHAEGIVNYIDSLKTELKTNAGYKSGNEKFNEDDTKSVTALFKDEATAASLLYKLKSFRSFILSCDHEVNTAFENAINILPASFDSAADENGFAERYVKHKPLIEVLASLSQFQNNICITENQVLTFLNNQSSGGCILRYEKFSAIATLSSTYVKQGGRIDISAGVGSFSTAASPKISINGNYVLLDENGVANYRLIAAKEPGKHIVPVKIDYTKPDGTITSESLSLEYVVSKDAAY